MLAFYLVLYSFVTFIVAVIAFVQAGLARLLHLECFILLLRYLLYLLHHHPHFRFLAHLQSSLLLR